MSWSESDWCRLATLFDGISPHAPGLAGSACSPACGARKPYPGYRPETVEAPAGDTKVCGRCVQGMRFPEGAPGRTCETCHGSGRVPNVDAAGVCGVCGGSGANQEDDGALSCRPCNGTGRAPGKRYLHVALKYDPPVWAIEYLARAHWEACRVATALGVPAAYRPHESDGTLRVIDYPPGVGTVEHTDSNLFTIVLWRSHPDDLQIEHVPGLIDDPKIRAARRLSPGLHIGELGALVGLGPAMPYRVPARPYRQRSIVYFAVPDHAARLHVQTHHVCERGETCASAGCTIGPITVGEYLADWKRRSRVAAGEYR